MKTTTLPSLFVAFMLQLGFALQHLSYAQVTICEPLSYYNPSGTTAVFVQRMPSARFAVKMDPIAPAKVDTAYIGFGLKKNSSFGYNDTLEVFVLDNNPPTFTQLDRDVFVIKPPFNQNTMADDFYVIELSFQNSSAFINPTRPFWLAYRFKGPASDTARILFKIPAINPYRSVVINANGSTTLATTFVQSQITDSVDLWAETHVCYPLGIPVELQALKAKLINDEAVLEWTTASETHNFGFEVERALSYSENGNGRMWQRIGFLPGQGTTTQQTSYRFIDRFPLAGADENGNVTYRLRQIDLDGQSYRSAPVLLSIHQSGLRLWLGQNFPNPFGTASLSGNLQTTISYSIARASNVSISVASLDGSLEKIISTNYHQAGYYSFTFDASYLPSGMYLYTLTTNEGSVTKKMTIAK